MTNKNRPKQLSIALAMLLTCLFFNSTKAQGPNAPEAASFEPVDATDMVNLVTGDLSYVLPLLNVPSPEGGYPIALSYHAGIAMEQEASWVGLGWSLNPGAINRSINGYPDDWNNGLKADQIYDIGGEYTGFRLGVSIGVSEEESVGLYASYSQNKAFGGETSHRLDFGVEALGLSLGTDGVGISLAGKATGNSFGDFSGGIGLNHSFINGKTGISANLGLRGLSTGISLDSRNGFGAKILGNQINLSGSSTQSTQLSYRNTNIQGFIPITVLTNVSFGYQKSRYWLFDRTLNNSFGALYFGELNQAYSNALFQRLIMADAYEAIYEANQSLQLGKNNFSFVSYDSYSVSGQGIGGSITPKLYEIGALKLKSQKTDDGDGYSNMLYDNGFVKQVDNPNNDIYFYFDNTNSSYLRTSIDNIGTPVSGINSMTDVTFNNEILDSSVLIDGVVQDNFNALSKRKNNGSFVEVYTNGEILNNPSLIIEAKHLDRQGYATSNFIFDFGYEDGIGAYKITAQDGKTYHYSLPVYQKEKFTRTSELDENINEKFYEEQSISPYATHWLLTAITGPDYIDINSNGELDENDYGYWVEFEYGKWSDDYVWRSPTDPNKFFTTDKSKSYTMGVKEVYYLDKIRTRTHSALFIKEDRKDNMSYAANLDNDFDDVLIKSFIQGSDGNWYLKGLYDNTISSSFNNLQGSPVYYYAKTEFRLKVQSNSHKSLMLKKILVLDNSKIPSSLATENLQEPTSTYQGNLNMREYAKIYSLVTGQYISGKTTFAYPHGTNGRNLHGEHYENILNTQDLTVLAPNLEQDALEVLNFNFDETYPLSKNSPNSNAFSSGKLTLKSVNMNGKGGVSLKPPYEFEYAKNSLSYNYDSMDDWGYYNDNPEAWSLNKITTPIGSIIDIKYEEDDYHSEAVDSKRVFSNGLDFFLDFPAGNSSADIILLVTNDNDIETDEIDDFRNHFQLGNNARMSNFFICRREKYGGSRRETKLHITEENSEVIAVNETSVQIKINGSSNFWSFDDQDMGWLTNRTFAHNGVWHSNGNVDGVIMRNEQVSENDCYGWRSSYNNSDVTFFYRLVGNKSLKDTKGGGIRVKQISLSDGARIYSKNYKYNTEGFNDNPNHINYKSSGVTSYTPSKYGKEIKYLTELPSPYVMYNRVCVEDAKTNNKTIYNFNTLNPALSIDNGAIVGIGGLLTINVTQDEVDTNIVVNGESSTVTRKKYELQNNLASLGRLNSSETLNSYGQLLSKTVNNYETTSNIKQGVCQETFKVFKNHKLDGNIENHITISSKYNYPSELRSTSVTKGGYTSTTYFEKYDFNTGQVIETRTINSTGNEFKTEVVPAYTISSYNPNNGYGMGSKVDDETNYNMLTQKAMTKTYLKVGSNWEETSVGITTWNNNWAYTNYDGSTSGPTADSLKIWRKHKSFVWDGGLSPDGTLIGFTGNDDSFVWDLGHSQTNSEWKNISTTTQYDHYSLPLEIKDINDNYVSKKTCDGESKILAVCNAEYSELYYSGAEYFADTGEVYFDSRVRATGHQKVGQNGAHTGESIIRLTNTSQKGFEVYLPANTVRTGLKGKFKVSVWAKKGQEQRAKIRVGNSDMPFATGEAVYAGDWVLLNGYITIPSAATTVSIMSTGGTLDLDDFRLHPIASSMTSYVYNEWDELWCIIGTNGLASKFEYDVAGRLIKTYAEVEDYNSNPGGFKPVKENKYHYKDQP